MKRRLLIPTDDPQGSRVAAHFGRAPFFVVLDLGDDGSVLERQVNPNRGEHSGGRGHAHDNVLRFNPNVVIVQGMGPRGLMSFQGQNIAVLKADTLSVDDLIKAYADNKLEELTNGCADAHHR
jgi:predicted Fe-Mo cluster-binding NifX family protein